MYFQSRPIFINKHSLTSTPETSFTHSLYAKITTVLTSNIISWIFLPAFEFHTYGIKSHVLFCFWLLLLNNLFLWTIHCVCIAVVVHCRSYVAFHCMNILQLLTHFLVYWCWTFRVFLNFTSSPAKNVLAHMVEHVYTFLWDIHLRLGWVGHIFNCYIWNICSTSPEAEF